MVILAQMRNLENVKAAMTGGLLNFHFALEVIAQLPLAVVVPLLQSWQLLLHSESGDGS